jgi:hypothetical protein
LPKYDYKIIEMDYLDRRFGIIEAMARLKSQKCGMR